MEVVEQQEELIREEKKQVSHLSVKPVNIRENVIIKEFVSEVK